jgi:hypothetical protein
MNKTNYLILCLITALLIAGCAKQKPSVVTIDMAGMGSPFDFDADKWHNVKVRRFEYLIMKAFSLHIAFRIPCNLPN